MTTAPSVVTLTMNPALDLTTETEVVRPVEKMRCGPTRLDPGGGGINVARVAAGLGVSAAAVFPVGGSVGTRLLELLGRAIPVAPVPIVGCTRESFTVTEQSTSRQFRFVLPGPELTPAEQIACLDTLREKAAGAQFVVASGSLPPGVPANFYQQVADLCHGMGVPFVIDTSGRGLSHLVANVFLLKASLRELADCAGRNLAADRDRIAAARGLIERGVAEVVVLSCGSEGALLVTGDTALRFCAVPVDAVSGVGAGDAMVAAVVTGLCQGWPLEESVRFGVAAGAAMLLTPGTAVCRQADVERLFALAQTPTPVG